MEMVNNKLVSWISCSTLALIFSEDNVLQCSNGKARIIARKGGIQ